MELPLSGPNFSAAELTFNRIKIDINPPLPEILEFKSGPCRPLAIFAALQSTNYNKSTTTTTTHNHHQYYTLFHVFWRHSTSRSDEYLSVFTTRDGY